MHAGSFSMCIHTGKSHGCCMTGRLGLGRASLVTGTGRDRKHFLKKYESPIGSKTDRGLFLFVSDGASKCEHEFRNWQVSPIVSRRNRVVSRNKAFIDLEFESAIFEIVADRDFGISAREINLCANCPN